MVKGLDKFRDHFSNFGVNYVLIGGTACDLAFSALGLEFRTTRDLDIVLMVELLDEAFGQVLMDFVEAGGYEHRQRAGDGDALQFSGLPDRNSMIIRRCWSYFRGNPILCVL
jgi:hypothetical protein